MKRYVVLKKDGVTGLTVGSKVLHPGKFFTERDWPYGEDKLNVAIDRKRCAPVDEKSSAKEDLKTSAKEKRKSSAKEDAE